MGCPVNVRHEDSLPSCGAGPCVVQPLEFWAHPCHLPGERWDSAPVGSALQEHREAAPILLPAPQRTDPVQGQRLCTWGWSVSASSLGQRVAVIISCPLGRLESG